MDDANMLPSDLAECQQLLLAAYRQSRQLEQRAAEAEQQVTELNRVLDETAASHEELQQEHAARLDRSDSCGPVLAGSDRRVLQLRRRYRDYLEIKACP